MTSVSTALETVTSIDFGNKDKFMIFNVANLSMDGSFSGKGSNADPNVVYREKLNLDASEIKAIKIEAQIPKGLPAEVYFTTEEGNNFSADNRFRFTSDSDEMKTYIIYTSTNKNWKGTIYEIRIDPVAGADCAGLDFEWKALEFCK